MSLLIIMVLNLFVCQLDISLEGPMNRNSTLWSSWAIKSDIVKYILVVIVVMVNILRKWGGAWPFDFSLIDYGQYNKAWKFSHMFPKQAINAALDLNTKYLIPIHWGAFTLASHS